MISVMTQGCTGAAAARNADLKHRGWLEKTDRGHAHIVLTVDHNALAKGTGSEVGIINDFGDGTR
jgi:hypothetical protein